MSLVFKTTVNSPSTHVTDRDAEDALIARASTYTGEEMAGVPIDQLRLLEAIGDTMGMLAAEQRKEREQEFGAMRQKIATLEGRVDVLMSLMMEGRGQIIDLPPLPTRKRHVA
jgi:hypothetical protein